MAKSGKGQTNPAPASYAPMLSARIDVPKGQVSVLRELDVGKEIECKVKGKVVRVEMVKHSDGYECNSFTIEPVKLVKIGGEFDELSEDEDE